MAEKWSANKVIFQANKHHLENWIITYLSNFSQWILYVCNSSFLANYFPDMTENFRWWYLGLFPVPSSIKFEQWEKQKNHSHEIFHADIFRLSVEWGFGGGWGLCVSVAKVGGNSAEFTKLPPITPQQELKQHEDGLWGELWNKSTHGWFEFSYQPDILAPPNECWEWTQWTFLLHFRNIWRFFLCPHLSLHSFHPLRLSCCCYWNSEASIHLPLPRIILFLLQHPQFSIHSTKYKFHTMPKHSLPNPSEDFKDWLPASNSEVIECFLSKSNFMTWIILHLICIIKQNF